VCVPWHDVEKENQSVLFIWSIWLGPFNQIHEIDRIGKTDQMNQTDQSSRGSWPVLQRLRFAQI
jgi:hypothetical protein